MSQSRSPTLRLLAGLAITLSAVALYSGYTVTQLHGLERLQGSIIDRNRADSLLLLRIQNNLNSLGLAMRDMLDGTEPYPLTAWQGQFRRMRTDLEDAIAREAQSSPLDRDPAQGRYLSDSLRQFWDALDRIFALAQRGQEAEARTQIRLSLQSRQEAIVTAVARLLVLNNEAERQAAVRIRDVYAGVERNLYLFVAAMLVLILLTGLYLVHSNRVLFQEVADLSARRSELAQQLIAMQENTFSSISRDLHDDFGQILTAIGVMLQRTTRLSAGPEAVSADLREVQEIVQSTLDKVRTLSHALHPVILDEIGFEGALEQYLPGFQKQTGIEVRYEKSGTEHELDRGVAIHLYRVMQEALNNIARHSQSKHAEVRLRYQPESVVLEVQDHGVGFGNSPAHGLGLVSMRERAGLVNGRLDLESGSTGGALVRFTVPANTREAHA
ncbi:MAG: integral rane sensor signal transduction histidine kinase [Candidatus Solibacter sp.]|nr:integral rane sensor signal transduction histidine kinase [Candidatus Solibacter sp.]